MHCFKNTSQKHYPVRTINNIYKANQVRIKVMKISEVYGDHLG